MQTMFRPIVAIGRKVTIDKHSKNFVSNKIVRPASVLKAADKLKLYNRETKGLFGPLLDTNKQKKQRSQKAAKNNPNSHLNNTNAAPCKNIENKFNVIQNITTNVENVDPKLEVTSDMKINPFLALDSFKMKILHNTRTCVNLVGGLVNVRGYKTTAASYTARSFPAEPGYASEDKILQIKQRHNDYAQQYPSVTLILNKTMTEESRTALEKWKQERIAEIGEEEFNKFYEAQMAVGTKFHSTLKNYFTQPRTQLRIEKDVEGVWNSVEHVLKCIAAPKAIESNVVHPLLKYRGIFDAIADYEDKPTLIEWKKSDKPRKSIALTYDNPVQLAAYFGAVANDLNYKHFNVRDALLVIAYTDGSKADAYHLSTDKLREHWAQWLMRLEQFTKKFGNDAERSLKGGKRLFEEDIEHLQ